MAGQLPSSKLVLQCCSAFSRHCAIFPGYIFPISLCLDLDDPTDGGWGEWSDFTCTVSCGGGFGYRKRKCNKPKPTYFGATCIGPSSEDGECNKFECGCLNPGKVNLHPF